MSSKSDIEREFTKAQVTAMLKEKIEKIRIREQTVEDVRVEYLRDNVHTVEHPIGRIVGEKVVLSLHYR